MQIIMANMCEDLYSRMFKFRKDFATDSRQGGTIYSRFIWEYKIKWLLKWLYICQSYHQDKSVTLFMAHTVALALILSK